MRYFVPAILLALFLLSLATLFLDWHILQGPPSGDLFADDETIQTALSQHMDVTASGRNDDERTVVELQISQLDYHTVLSRSLPWSLPEQKVFMVGPWIPEALIAHNLNVDPDLEFHVFNYSSMARSVKEIDMELCAAN